jgi:hypothetical protein
LQFSDKIAIFNVFYNTFLRINNKHFHPCKITTTENKKADFTIDFLENTRKSIDEKANKCYYVDSFDSQGSKNAPK